MQRCCASAMNAPRGAESRPDGGNVNIFQAHVCCASQKKHAKIGSWRPRAGAACASKAVAELEPPARSLGHQGVAAAQTTSSPGGENRPSRAAWPAQTVKHVVLQHTEFTLGRQVRLGTLFARDTIIGPGVTARQRLGWRGTARIRRHARHLVRTRQEVRKRITRVDRRSGQVGDT